MYCSEECRQKAAPTHLSEKFTLFGNGFFKASIKMQREAVSIAGGVKELFQLLEGNKNKTVFDLDFSKPEDGSYEKNKLIALNGLHRGTMKDTKWTPKDFLENSPIIDKTRTAKERTKLLEFAIDQFKIVRGTLSNFRGAGNSDGIYPFKSLLNHSCFPDVQPYKFGDKLALVVVRPIKAGAQIHVCYGFAATLLAKKERLQYLGERPFKCECEACVTDYDPDKAPRKDCNFPESYHTKIAQKVAPAEAFKRFKENCKYIDENAHKMPCFEVQLLININVLLVQMLDPSASWPKGSFFSTL